MDTLHEDPVEVLPQSVSTTERFSLSRPLPSAHIYDARIEPIPPTKKEMLVGASSVRPIDR